MKGPQETLYSVFESLDKEGLIKILKKGSNSIFCSHPDLVEWTEAIFSDDTYKTLRESKLYTILEEINVPTNAINHIFIPCPDDPTFFTTKMIPYLQNWSICSKTILMVPRYSPRCKAAYEKVPENLKNNLSIIEFNAEIIPLSPKHFVVPLPLAYSNLYCDYDISDIFAISHALTKFQLINGKPLRTFAAGPSSVRILQMMHDMHKNIGENYFAKPSSFDYFIILDRNCDKLTPFMTSMNYASQVDSILNPVLQRIKFPGDIKACSLETDPVYNEIQELDWGSATVHLKKILNEIKEVTSLVQEMKGNSQKFYEYGIRVAKIISIKDQFSKHLNFITANDDKRSTGFYLSLSGETAPLNCDPDLIENDLIFDLIRRRSYTLALRLLILKSISGNGVSENLIKSVCTKMCNVIGYNFYSEFYRLLSSGLVRQEKGIFQKNDEITFNQVSDLLKLYIQTAKDAPKPETYKYFMEYIPISVRLVEEALRNQWNPGTSGKKALDGMLIPTATDISETQIPLERRPINKEDKPFYRVLVFIVGGVSVGEVQMFKNLGDLFFSNNDYTYEVHVGSTDIISSDRLIHQICPSLKK